MIRLRKKKQGFFEQLIATGNIIAPDNLQQSIQFLTSFFSEIRPGSGKKSNAERNLLEATIYLKENPVLLANMQHAMLCIVNQTHLLTAITESGIPMGRGFWQEFFNRWKHKILPPLQDTNDFLYTLNQIFYEKTDYKWIESIDRDAWISFFNTCGFSMQMANRELKQELMQALKVLSFQVAQLGLEKVVISYLPPEQQNHDTTFVLQNYRVHDLENLVLDNAAGNDLAEAAVRLKNDTDQCYDLIQHIRESHSVNGASIQQTYLLLILENRLNRMQLLLDILDADNRFDTGRFVDIFLLLVRNEKRKYSIREFLSQGLGYLAYQIAEHKGNKGHKYITETRREYNKMIRTSMAGGIIISFIAVFKNLIGKMSLAPFPIGFLYSVNYSIGFVAIDQTGSSLATKQPAFTASALASSLDTRKAEGMPDIDGLAQTVAKVSRSQIASFFGNLIVVFPLTFLLGWGYYELFDKRILSEAEAFQVLKEQHPWRSAALLYACFTGVFLFLSGLIAGYWQNKIRYGHIRERLLQSNGLTRTFSARRLVRFSNYIEKQAGAIIGNIALGFFLGFSGVLGKIFGIPFDIRHITIAAGNAGIAIYDLGLDNIPPYFLLAVLGGILAIGFLNFLVSFALAFFMAIKSRGIRLSQYPRLFRTIWKYWWQHPGEYLRPPKEIPEPDFKSLK